MGQVGDRLREERDRLDLSQADFAALAGQGRSSQIRYEAGERAPDTDYLAKIAEAGADIVYILTGQRDPNPMPAAARVSAAPARDDEGDATDALPPRLAEDFALIPRFRVNLSAGPGLVPAEEDGGDHLAFSRAWLRRTGIDPRRAGLVRVQGDSMQPAIPDGALVLVDMGATAVRAEGVFAFSRDGDAFVKRIVPVNKARDGRPSSVVILSDNPLHPPDVLVGEDLNSIRIVGQVRCVIFDL